MIDLITGHQGIPHISAEQISTLHRSLMGTSGDNTVIKMTGGNLAQAGLAVEISAGFWRVHGYDMEIQEGETVLFDPTESGYSRIDNVYVEVLQDISSGVQRAELVNVMGEPSTTTPIAPSAPTEPENSYDILVVAVPVLTATITEGAMTFTDLTTQYDVVTQEDIDNIYMLAMNAKQKADDAYQTATNAGDGVQIVDGKIDILKETVFGSSDLYSALKSYEVGDYCIYNNILYRCTTACSPASWNVNSGNFTQDTLANAVANLNSALSKNALNAMVAISSNTTLDGDGYIVVNAGTTATLKGSSGSGAIGLNSTGKLVVPVKKGMKVEITSPNEVYFLKFS